MAFVKTPPSLPSPFLWNRLANKTDYDVDERHNSVLLFSLLFLILYSSFFLYFLVRHLQRGGSGFVWQGFCGADFPYAEGLGLTPLISSGLFLSLVDSRGNCICPVER